LTIHSNRQRSSRRAKCTRLKEALADLPVDHFNGLDTFEDQPSDGRCVRDLWFWGGKLQAAKGRLALASKAAQAEHVIALEYAPRLQEGE
jgi:hypothetical protein